MWIHLLALELIDGAGSEVAPTSNSGGYAGGDRAWYYWKGNRLYLNHGELAQLFDDEEDELRRSDLKVTTKKAKKRTVDPQTWAAILENMVKTAKSADLPVELPEENDDEEAMELLLAYL